MSRAIVLLIVSIGLGSIGCSTRQAVAPPAPVIMSVALCPVPARPELPQVDGRLPFDSPTNIEAFLERDDLYRAYIQGLESTMECYRRQIGGTKWE